MMDFFVNGDVPEGCHPYDQIEANADVLLSEVVHPDELAGYSYPRYDDKATVLVAIYPPVGRVYRFDHDILDDDGGRVLELINEGIGMEWFLEQCCDIPGPGVYVISGIEGEYHRGNWSWGEDDDEEFWCEAVRPATLRERVLERLD